jgi:hypothetical protein
VDGTVIFNQQSEQYQEHLSLLRIRTLSQGAPIKLNVLAASALVHESRSLVSEWSSINLDQRYWVAVCKTAH